MTYAIATLGCKVNTYESNVMIDLLNKEGYQEVPFNSLADIYIINTCTVTNTADSKSMKLIRQAINKNEKAIIIAVGCLVQTGSDKVIGIPGVDIIIGNKNKTNIIKYIKDFLDNQEQITDINDICEVDFEKMQVNNFNKTRAFVKIEDGCNNYCSYCIIPYARGNVRSKDLNEVIKEIENLVKEGHQEIVLTGIHTGAYGIDKNMTLADLLLKIVNIKDLKRIRISSIEITEINNDVLKLLADYPILVDHMHIPLQSGNDKILKLMNRKYNIEYFNNKINEIKKVRPNMLITTDVIVGFPGETEEDFLTTIENIKKIKFHKLHVFPYSKRNNTPAALMENQVDNLVKKIRVNELIRLSKELELKDMEDYVGKKITFIPEVEKNGYLIGHAGNYLQIKTPKDSNVIKNQEIEITIESIDYPHCVGKI